MSVLQKFLAVIFPIGAFIAEVVTSLPWFQERFPLAVKALNQLWVGIVLILLFSVNQLCSIRKPFREADRLHAVRSTILEAEMGPLFSEYYRTFGAELRANVMLLRPRLLARLEPTRPGSEIKKLSLLPRCLSMAWFSNNLEHSAHRTVTYTINQGPYGYAARDGGICLWDVTELSYDTLNTSADQLRKISDLRFAITCPIYELPYNGNPSDDRHHVIGVFSIDSIQPGSEALIQDMDCLDDLTRRIEAAAHLCSRLY